MSIHNYSSDSSDGNETEVTVFKYLNNIEDNLPDNNKPTIDLKYIDLAHNRDISMIDDIDNDSISSVSTISSVSLLQRVNRNPANKEKLLQQFTNYNGYISPLNDLINSNYISDTASVGPVPQSVPLKSQNDKIKNISMNNSSTQHNNCNNPDVLCQTVNITSPNDYYSDKSIALKESIARGRSRARSYSRNPTRASSAVFVSTLDRFGNPTISTSIALARYTTTSASLTRNTLKPNTAIQPVTPINPISSNYRSVSAPPRRVSSPQISYLLLVGKDNEVGVRTSTNFVTKAIPTNNFDPRCSKKLQQSSSTKHQRHYGTSSTTNNNNNNNNNNNVHTPRTTTAKASLESIQEQQMASKSSMNSSVRRYSAPSSRSNTNIVNQNNVSTVSIKNTPVKTYNVSNPNKSNSYSNSSKLLTDVRKSQLSKSASKYPVHAQSKVMISTSKERNHNNNINNNNNNKEINNSSKIISNLNLKTNISGKSSLCSKAKTSITVKTDHIVDKQNQSLINKQMDKLDTHKVTQNLTTTTSNAIYSMNPIDQSEYHSPELTPNHYSIETTWASNNSIEKYAVNLEQSQFQYTSTNKYLTNPSPQTNITSSSLSSPSPSTTSVSPTTKTNSLTTSLEILKSPYSKHAAILQLAELSSLKRNKHPLNYNLNNVQQSNSNLSSTLEQQDNISINTNVSNQIKKHSFIQSNPNYHCVENLNDLSQAGIVASRLKALRDKGIKTVM